MPPAELRISTKVTPSSTMFVLLFSPLKCNRRTDEVSPKKALVGAIKVPVYLPNPLVTLTSSIYPLKNSNAPVNLAPIVNGDWI